MSLVSPVESSHLRGGCTVSRLACCIFSFWLAALLPLVSTASRLHCWILSLYLVTLLSLVSSAEYCLFTWWLYCLSSPLLNIVSLPGGFTVSRLLCCIFSFYLAAVQPPLSSAVCTLLPGGCTVSRRSCCINSLYLVAGLFLFSLANTPFTWWLQCLSFPDVSTPCTWWLYCLCYRLLRLFPLPACCPVSSVSSWVCSLSLVAVLSLVSPPGSVPFPWWLFCLKCLLLGLFPLPAGCTVSVIKLARAKKLARFFTKMVSHEAETFLIFFSTQIIVLHLVFKESF